MNNVLNTVWNESDTGHVLTNMRKRRHLESHECVSPVGGMFHWNFFSVDPASDACLTHKVNIYVYAYACMYMYKCMFVCV